MPSLTGASKWNKEEHSQRQHRAIKTLQQWFRSWGKPKKQKSQAFRWPTIFELRGLYLDPDAVAAGAVDSEMYSDEALKEREQLRSSPEVRAHLQPECTPPHTPHAHTTRTGAGSA